jgi:ceramide glucosyltransferase
VIGQSLAGLGERVALGRARAINVATTRSVRSFFDRYARWSVIHRTAISFPTYLSQAALNPWPLTVLALALAPSRAALLLSAAVLLVKAAVDCSAARALGVGNLGLKALLAVPLKDGLLFAAWLQGLVSRTVLWRGNRLRVTAGSVLVPHDAPLTAPVEVR